jgi:enoyl-CoA hydratase/carnithine racemase
MSDGLLYAKDGPIVTLTINRPETRNALGDPGDIQIWVDLVARINADRDVRAVILTGAGKAFSAGGNVKAMAERGGMFEGGGVAIRENYRRTVHRIVRAVWSIEVPTIAAVNGPAIGLGNDIACLCDTRIAAASAIFGVTFLKIGLVPGDGGAWLLPRIIGMAKASELFFTGDVIKADEAMRIGLVSRVVPDEALMDEARSLASRMAAQPPDVLRMTKKLLREGMAASFDAILDMSAGFQALAHQTEDHQEAIAAFMEKRPGVFRGA